MGDNQRPPMLKKQASVVSGNAPQEVKDGATVTKTNNETKGTSGWNYANLET